MPSISLDRIVDRRLSGDAHASDRYSDLQIAYVDETTGDLIGRLGGKWDRFTRTYVGDADHEKIVTFHPGQLEFARWFCNTWLTAHLDGWPAGTLPIYTALVAGGRRAGKTRMLAELVAGYSVAIEQAITWIVVPSDVENYGEELRSYLEATLALDWYTALGSPYWSYTLINGSVIRLMSGFTPRKLKKGGAGLILMNEGQQIPKKSYQNVRASIADHFGLVTIAANPPDEDDVGAWVADIASGTQSGQLENAKAFFVDPLANPHIDQVALMSLADTMSAHEFDVQIRGMFHVPKNSVLSAWNRLENEKQRPEVGEITERFTFHHESYAYKHVIGIDVQKFPWIVGAVAHAYANPDAPGDMNEALLWFDDEVFVDNGDEIDLANVLIDRGYDPRETLLVVDASGDWQQAERRDKFKRPEYRGAGSYDMLRGAGFRSVVPPDPDMKANPAVLERVRGANARIGTKSRKRYVFADPTRCPRLVSTIANWKATRGRPSRTSEEAHAGDAITYLIWRFFPRRRQATGDSIASGMKVLRRFEGEKRTRGW